MNKREFAKVPQPEATDEMILLAERSENIEYIATAENIVIADEKILLLTFFKRSQLVEKKKGAALRTFLSHDDYITQDLTVTRTKWKTGCFKSLFEWRFWNSRPGGQSIIFHADNDYQTVRKYMKRYLGGENPSVWESLESFQDDVMERRLMERHKKETDRIDQKMELVPEKPEGFDKWAHDKAMGDKRYLVYTTGKQKILSGYCTSCRKTVEIDTQSAKPRNKQRGICPACGGEITYIPKGYFPVYQRDDKWACLIQKVETGIVTRYFHVFQEIQRDNHFKEKFYIGEYCRIFYEESEIELHRECYEWGVYKQHGPSRWCPDMDIHRCAEAVLYTENLPQAFEGMTFQYCAADLFQKKKGCEPIPIYRYLANYPCKRFLEYFVKVGMLNLTESIVNGSIYCLNTSGKTPTEILGIPADYIRILSEIDGTEGEYRLLKQCVADKVLPKGDEIEQFYSRFGGNDELIGVINNHISIGKFVRYMDKQKKMLPKEQKQPCCHAGMMSTRHYTKEEKEYLRYKDLSKDWLDYISWCAQLKYNMNDLYVLLPPDFKKAHDRVMEEYQAYKDEMARKRRIEMEKQIKAVLKLVASMPAMEMKTKKLMMMVPQNGEEIKAEGRVLHHCVGTYVERVAKGETMILFVRRIESPEEPFFTLEYRDGKVIQCRGKNNCSMTKEVKAFVKAFEAKMNSQKEVQVRVKVG